MAELKYWTGSAWAKPKAVKRWSGSAWVDAKGMSYWNGSKWVALSLGESLFMLGVYPSRAYLLSLDTLLITKTFNFPGNANTGAHSIGGTSGRLYAGYVINNETHVLGELNISTLAVIGPTRTFNKQVRAPWVGGTADKLYRTKWYGTIAEINKDTLADIKTVDFPYSYPKSIGGISNRLWVQESDEGTFEINPSTMVVIKKASGGSDGIGGVGNRLFVGYGHFDGETREVNPNTFAIIKRGASIERYMDVGGVK